MSSCEQALRNYKGTDLSSAGLQPIVQDGMGNHLQHVVLQPIFVMDFLLKVPQICLGNGFR